MKILRVALFDLHSVLLLHVGQADTLDGIFCDHHEVLGPLGATVVAALVVHVEKVAMTVYNTGKDGGMVPLLVELFV